ncbi:MAG: SH3 domain-containing protein [Fidelibacterota bacterium]
MTALYALRAAVILLLFDVVSPAATLRVVVKDRVNFREGPGRNYPILDQLYGGDIVIQTNQTREWIHVQRGNGNYGWVNVTMLAADAGKSLLPDLQLYKRGNLRVTPTTAADIINQLEPPQLLKQVFQTGTWHAVITEDASFGWVHDVIIKEISNLHGTIQVLTASNIRSGPGTAYTIITEVEPGTALIPIAQFADWFLVETKSRQRGWVYHRLVQIELPGQAIDRIVRIRTNGNVRSGPGLDYPVTNHISAGIEFPVTNIHEDWFQIGDGAPVSGWIHRILTDTDSEPVYAVENAGPSTLELIKATIDSAHNAHINQHYYDAIALYHKSRADIRQLYLENPANPCIRFYYARNIYALAEHLHLEPNQASAEAYQILKETSLTEDCAENIINLIRSMEESVTIRSAILGAFGGTDLLERRLINYGERAPHIFPFITEAEIYRLIGRYLALQKNKSAEAAQWQQKSVVLYQSLLKNGIELGSLGLENYFYVLMELGVSQAKLGFDTSMDYFAKALELIEANQNNYWRNYYRRTLETIAR